MAVSLILRCAGCAAAVDPADPSTRSPFRCPNAERARDIDHVLAWDPVSAGVTEWPTETSTNPYVRYRTLQHAYWLNRALGATDADHVALVERLDKAIAGVGGTGFVATPMIELNPASTKTLGVDEVWAKVETRNVAQSHKARHLMGILLNLEVRRISARVPLAIASCGNAAIAAATLGKASRRVLNVFIPTWTKPAVREHLRSLGATLTECPRLPSDPPGDPCLHRFHDALAKGALPFCVQGSENGFSIDGGASLGHEMADQFAMLGFVPDRLFVQVGGGALGASIIRGLSDAAALGVIPKLPIFHVVQAEGCAPLVRAWRLVAKRALRSLGREQLTQDHQVAAAVLLEDASRAAVTEALTFAATHRSRFMWPWEEEPTSIATGILDDETYDWFALVGAMLATGGWPIVATDSQFERALELACPEPAAGDCCDADETGTAGLAGPLALGDNVQLGASERVCVVFSGARRT